jgi:hypothetical protein
VIIDQDNFFIYVQFPHNDVLKRIVYNLKGRWNSGKFSWGLPQKQTEEFKKQLEAKVFSMVTFKEPKLGNSISNLTLMFFF